MSKARAAAPTPSTRSFFALPAGSASEVRYLISLSGRLGYLAAEDAAKKKAAAPADPNAPAKKFVYEGFMQPVYAWQSATGQKKK